MEESNTKELEDNTAELRLEQVKRALNRKTLKSRKIQLEYNRQRAVNIDNLLLGAAKTI